MADDTPTDLPDWLTAAAERRGLAAALAMVPAVARPALTRAAQPLPLPPSGAAAEPAAGFDPRAHEGAP